MKCMVELQEFTNDEIADLERYIRVHANVTILQKIYTLSENPIDKAIIFINVYRILDSCKNYTKGDLHDKMVKLFNEFNQVYNEVYPLIISYLNKEVEVGKERLKKRIIAIISIPDNSKKIRKAIDSFLVFGEKIEMNKTEDYIGVDLENDYGKDAMKEVRKVIETENI